MKFAVVIVTYNRKELLKECMGCVLGQTVPFSHICIVDNHSNDGTGQYLDKLAADLEAKSGPVPDIWHLDENLGGAGGFAFGLSKLTATDCDWFLIIDDDAMIAPDYIQKLLEAILATHYLAYSGAVTTEGSIDTSHRRILKNPCLMTYKPVDTAAYAAPSFEYDVSTFCGLLLNAALVREIGLPKTEYFIWFDDTEYCLRFRGRSRILNVTSAVLNHKTTPPRHAPAITWKNFYGFRNSIDIGNTYSTHPAVFRAYIVLNHLTHIFLDMLGLAVRNEPELRRYRIQVYRDVLKGRHQKPNGRNPQYLPGTGPK